VLTHIYPAAEELDLVTEVGGGFEGEILVADDGLELEV
jgi:ribonuclease BN (tRNA processing enzyme)